MIQIGIKTDPINTRYSFDWLFDLLVEEGINYIQLGSFFELYSLEDDYFLQLNEKAASKGLKFKSVFTAYRELGGFFYSDKYMEKVARKNYEQLIHVASLLGADYCGSNPGAIYRDQMKLKAKGISCYLNHMKELMHLAHLKGLKALTIEPMSCLAEPPTTPQEIDYMIGMLLAYHKKEHYTVPVFLCGDISHGYANSEKKIIHSNTELFKHSIPNMVEFHFKNTDQLYTNTFGFSLEEQSQGIVDLLELKKVIDREIDAFPVHDVVGYLEIGGPKTGRDYSDPLLDKSLRTSLRAIREIFPQSVSAFVS